MCNESSADSQTRFIKYSYYGAFNKIFEGVLLILKTEIIIIFFFKVNFMCWGEKFNNGFLEKFGERHSTLF